MHRWRVTFRPSSYRPMQIVQGEELRREGRHLVLYGSVWVLGTVQLLQVWCAPLVDLVAVEVHAGDVAGLGWRTLIEEEVPAWASASG